MCVCLEIRTFTGAGFEPQARGLGSHIPPQRAPVPTHKKGTISLRGPACVDLNPVTSFWAGLARLCPHANPKFSGHKLHLSLLLSWASGTMGSF